MSTTDPAVPRSTLFQPPGRPLAPARQDRVRQLLSAELTAAVADHGLRLEASADPALQVLRGGDLGLGGFCDFAEATLKRAVRRLSADLIGGANVTRLDGTLAHRHPRLPYRRALRIVGARGWRLALGEELTDEAQASLVRFCGLLPVQVLMLPGQPRPASIDGRRAGLSYVLPWGGEVLRGEIASVDADADGPVLCRFHLDRLLRFVLGLDRESAASA